MAGEKEILAGSVVLPTSPIGLSEKAGMRETDWNRKGERGTERGNSCGLAHCTKGGVACCVFIVKDGEKQALRGVTASSLLLPHFVFCTCSH